MTNDTLDTTILDDVVQFYRDWYDEAIAKLAQRFPKDQTVLTVGYGDLRTGLPDLADDYLQKPEYIRAHLEEGLAMYELPVDIDLSDATVRITGLADAADEVVWDVGEYFPQDIADQFTLVRGQVVKRSQPTLRPTRAVWECQRCGNVIELPQPRDEPLQEPHEGSQCERQGPFLTQDAAMVDGAVNHQTLRLQTPPEKAAGRSDDTLDVVVEQDLVKTCEPGDRVVVGADIRPQADENADQAEIGMLARADSIQKEESDFTDLDYDDYIDDIEEIANSADPYQKIVDSILPSHNGDEEIKLAIALQLFGGVHKELGDGLEIRGDIHIFLVGDPGVGKSTLMRYVNQLAPRSIYTSGNGTTSAGLTAAAVQDDFGDGGWALKAGALVEAHRGVCCIDELDDMDEEDRAGLLQAMSDQEINISKAGINATLPAQTTVLAAANPELGRFDLNQGIAEQVDIDPALFSRFDLMFPLTDQPDQEGDAETAQHMMKTQRAGQERAANEYGTSDTDAEPDIEPELLRAYIARAREETPVLTDAAEERITEEYVKIRTAADEDGPVPTTPRMMECLTRLAEASARVRLDDTVAVDDAERAIELYREYMTSFGVDPESGQFDADVVETGTSNAQRERVNALLRVIRMMEDETDNGAPVSAVVDHPALDDHDDSKIEHEIQNLKGSGEIYEPRKDYLRTS